MKSIYTALALLAGAGMTRAQAPDQGRNWVVEISYYGGDGEFTIVNPQWDWIAPQDTVTYHTDDPGVLILRTDDGTVYRSAAGSITFTAQQIARTSKVRCTMLTLDGSLLGWEVDHDDRYGDGTPPGNTGNLLIWLAHLFGLR